ncbi:PREDICTED: uncharacterized protein LOC106114216 [Papilio xuthus]|uniref:Uncharacterized protein LOC106114216 n=1 Tax=Papilio xuthus TaxID=66420 RepID=A0AAJ7E4V0_PAPXU|nr:PREDICTED: uncharacterized protein LOC106114216 [Papilio xuthus]
MSYNSLVPTGNKNKYCVLCSINIDFNKLKHHVDSRQHIDNMKKYKYLEKYDKHLFRQILHTYHCSLCNIMFTYREVNLHITWPIHKQQLDICHKIVKNNRKTDVKNGTKQITIDLQKEILFTTYIEPKIKIGIYYEFSKNIQEISKKSKIIINNGRVLKISWDSWNGFFKTKSGIKCCLCQKDLKTYEQTNHSNNCGHLEKLEDNFLNEFNPALIRKINENILNCVTCNTELPYKYHIIIEHIKGKKHENIYELLVKDSSICNNYTDCADDIFTLQ